MQATDINNINSGLARNLASESGVDFYSCYQCLKCTNGCPVTFAMDLMPHQVVRMAQMGLIDRIAQSNTMWVCASCETCITRCPNQIDIPKLMDTLKRHVLASKKEPKEKDVAAFHQVFLDNIRRFGRVNESMLMGVYQLKSTMNDGAIDTDKIKKNIRLGLKMLDKGRLSLIPRKVAGKKNVRKLFWNK